MGLFLSIFIIASILSSQIQKRGRFNNFWFIVTFAFIAFFITFSDIGTDKENYEGMFSTYNTFSKCAFGELELGYQYLNALLNFFTSNEKYGVALIRFLQITVSFYAIYRMRHVCSVMFMIIAYLTFFYLTSFITLRMSLALGIVMLAYTFLYEEKFTRALLLVLLSCSMHRSAYIYLFTLLLYVLAQKSFLKKHPFKLSFSIIAIFLFVSTFLIQYIGGVITLYAIGEGRYDGYFDEMTEASYGLGIILIIAPLSFVIYKYRNAIKAGQNKWLLLNLIFSSMAIVCYLAAFQISIFVRMKLFLYMPFLFFLPYFITDNSIGLRTRSWYSLFLFILLFLLYLMNCQGTVEQYIGTLNLII